MRVMSSESWCFCNGGGKSERLKATIFNTKSSSMVKIFGTPIVVDEKGYFGTGFLIHNNNLLLTTHVNVPSVTAALNVHVLLQNGVVSTLVPHRFFITSSVLDLTIVGLDTIVDSFSQTQPPQYSKLCSKPSLELGNTVYLLGHAHRKELTIGEGKVVIATDNLIKLSTQGFTWSPGSAGFDSQGNLAFMICDPMKLSTLPNTKSTSICSSSYGSYVKDLPMQFGIPMPIIFDWLNRHWEGNLDDLNKPKLPLMRLVSVGNRSEHSCSSFTMKQIFKATDEIEGNTSLSNTVSKPKNKYRQLSEGEKVISQPQTATHLQGIRSPEIYESPKVTAKQVKNKDTQQSRLLNINFPPRISKAGPTRATQPSKDLLLGSGENCVNEAPQKPVKTSPNNMEKQIEHKREATDVPNEASSTGSVGDVHIARSSCSSIEVSVLRDDLSSEGETLYSAETAESRNYTSPREVKYHRSVGRSQSCMSYNRWGPVHRNPMAKRSSIQPRKTYSQGTPSHKTMDFISPTVSSIMKKRNNMNVERPTRTPTTAVHSSPRWNF